MNQINYRQASTYYLLGTLFNKGIAFLTVPIFTRIMSTADYGVVTTYNSWVAILAMVMGFALHMGIRSAFIDCKDDINDFMSTVYTFTIVFGGSVVVFVLIMISLFEVEISYVLILCCFLQGIASSLIEDYSMYLMMQYRYKFRTLLMIFPNLIAVILSVVIIVFLLENEIYFGRIVPTAVVTVLFGIVVSVLVFRKSKALFKKEYLKYGLAISGPLVLHGIALNILSQSDRTMLTWFSGAEQTGVYSLIYNFSMLATVLTTSMEGIWLPWFMKNYQMALIDKINTRVMDYVHIITYVMVVLLLVGPEIVKILAGNEYWGGIIIIPPVVISNYLIFIYTLYVNVEHYYKKTIFITVNTLIAATTNIILNFIFIPSYGYIAAAYTTLVAYFVALVLHTKYAKRLDELIYPIKKFVPSFLHIVGAIVIFYLFLEKAMFRWGFAVVYILIMVFLNRDIIKSYLPHFNKR